MCRLRYYNLCLYLKKEIRMTTQNISVPFIIFISGVSGAGKTTLLKKLCNQAPKSTECLHFDSIGVPSVEDMIKQYGSPSEWQRAMTNLWVDKLLTEYKDKKLIFLEGQVNLMFFEEACKKHNFTNYKTILIHCDDAIRHERLRANRNQPELINQDMDNWARFLKNQALEMNIPILDSGKMNIDEMADWIDSHYIKSLDHLMKFTIAKKALADFLKQPVNDIDCEPLIGGSEEDSILKCAYRATSYIVKLFLNKESGKNEIAWTQHACNLGIGPKLYYADATGNYMIIEFAKGYSLIPAIANMPAIIKNIAISLTRLHHSSAPFARTSDMFARIDAKYKKLNSSGKLKDILENGLQQVKKIEAQLKNISLPSAPCHNDLNPGNIFAYNNYVTLIDWGDAALGNPYYDIAAFFVLNCIEPKNEKLFFEQYDAKLLNPQWQACIKLYKQVVYFEFALNLLLGVQTGKSELLHAQHILQVNNINYYLTILAKHEMEIDSAFLYSMAIASLNAMALMRES
jgi:thiamine kinase-like enzyme/adenylate kinase family enzyme